MPCAPCARVCQCCCSSPPRRQRSSTMTARQKRALLLLGPCAASPAVVHTQEKHRRLVTCTSWNSERTVHHKTIQLRIADKSPPGIQARERTIFCVCSSVARSRAAVRARTVRPRGWWAENKLPRVAHGWVQIWSKVLFFGRNPPKFS